jgi:hypothetical protein
MRIDRRQSSPDRIRAREIVRDRSGTLHALRLGRIAIELMGLYNAYTMLLRRVLLCFIFAHIVSPWIVRLKMYVKHSIIPDQIQADVYEV